MTRYRHMIAAGTQKTDTGAGPSWGIFGDLPPSVHPEDLILDPGAGAFLMEDWINGVTFADATPQLGWDAHVSAGGGIGGVITDALADDGLGILRMDTDATDEDALILQYYSGLAGGILRTATQANGGKSWACEGRFRQDEVADSAICHFFGVAQGGANTGTNSVHTNATGALADIDLIGFNILAADGDSFDANFRVNGGAVVQHVDGALAITADTFYKLGLGYNAEKQELYYYANGKKVGTVSGSTITGATFPDQQEMAPIWAVKSTSASAKLVDCDWIWFAIERYVVS